MDPKFNIDRPKISDEEIKKHQNFEQLIKQFKQQSLNKAKHDKSWWKSKKVRYSAIIFGVTVFCTITYLAIINNTKTTNTAHETLITSQSNQTSKQINKAFIAEPSKKLKISYTSYKINNAKGGSISHFTNSKINIPKNTFIDKNGKEIIGDVTIEYREFNDVADIIVSGIPMIYDSAGTKYNLESAGMFDIKGSQNGEPVFIKPKQHVNVELTSNTNENRFNQYYLDTVIKNWEYLKKDNELLPIKSLTKQETEKESIAKLHLQSLKQQIEVAIPKKIDSVQFVYAKKIDAIKKTKEPSKPVKATGKPSFRLDGSYDDFPELSAFDDVVFEVGPENKNYCKELHEITWTDVKVSDGPIKGKNYLLTLSYRKKIEKLIVYPVFMDEDYDKAEKKYLQKFNEYKTLSEKQEATKKRLMDELELKQKEYLAELKKKQDDFEKEQFKLANAYKQKEMQVNVNTVGAKAKVTRIFNISQFGIYNSDCPHISYTGAHITPIFIQYISKKVIYPDAVYLIDHSNKTVSIVSPDMGFKVSYNPLNDYSICVFKQNNLFVCSKANFKNTINNASNKFTLEQLGGTENDLVELKKQLEI